MTRTADIRRSFDVAAVRRDFPILDVKIHGKPLVYLDNAATTQKPRAVLDTIRAYYESKNSNVHRGVHYLSEAATDLYERARARVRTFLNAAGAGEIVFVRGTTEAINLVCQSYGRGHVGAGDEVVVSAMEHHSNIVPWQMLCTEKDARLKVIPMDDRGDLLMDEYQKLLTARTRIVAVNHVSNALGTLNPVTEIVKLAHDRGIPVLIDGAQAVPHLPVDVAALGCDFYAFSGHKVYAPMGIGVLYGKKEILAGMPPYQGGGDMIKSVTFEKTIFNDVPHIFEAGTPNVGGAVGLAAAMDYISGIGIDAVREHEEELLSCATSRLSSVPGLRIVGTARQKAGVISFTLDDIHPHDIGTILDAEGIAVRTGHHCAQPVMRRFGIPATVRASFGLYNTTEEVDALAEGLGKVKDIFR
ncbi:MAG TPA: cysteine desulfurase [Bacteroidota bacterium]|nr:cysteine desulfurase [Bacteroidota bacterium]